MLTHRHLPTECATAFAAWRGFLSPLRQEETVCTCEEGSEAEHRMWWIVEADDPESALALLPEWLAERSETSRVAEVRIP